MDGGNLSLSAVVNFVEARGDCQRVSNNYGPECFATAGREPVFPQSL